MLATQIRQKDSVFYFGSYAAEDLLSRVRFISRFFGDDEEIAASRIAEGDDIAQFISRIEKSDAAFQRTMSRAKVKQLKNFYETAVTQPTIPGSVLLFTHEKLRFQNSPAGEGIGHLSEPQGKFLIIDGQHRWSAALRRPDIKKLPCLIVDRVGRRCSCQTARPLTQAARFDTADWATAGLATSPSSIREANMCVTADTGCFCGFSHSTVQLRPPSRKMLARTSA